LHFASLVVLTYLLGPFSVPLNPENRGRMGLLLAGVISGTAGVGLFAGRAFILGFIGRGWPLWPWALAGAAVMVTAFSIWSRAAFLAASRKRQPRHRLPSLLRKPWAVGVVGLMAPGLGLLLSGCARRGAAVIWAGWVVAASAMVLAGSPGIWADNLAGGRGSMDPVALETVFILAAGILAAGLMGWIAQALEGARQMMGEPGFLNRRRGDWYGAALLATLVGVVVVWDPSAMAGHLEAGSVVLREKGMRLIPLQLSWGAHRLDAGPSQYAIGAMELCEELGRTEEAARWRSELDGNLGPYLALVQSAGEEPLPGPPPGRSVAREWGIVADMWGQAGFREGTRPSYQAR
jgi:hypothetical protein